MIIRIDEISRDDVGIVPYKNKISNIVRSIKTLASKEIGKSIFQRSFYDHIIRNQDDYNEKWEYIENNPAKWLLMKQPLNPES